MTKMDRKGVAVLIAAMVLASGFVISVPRSGDASYVSSNAIRINGDGDLLYEVLNNSWTGTGSASDPYLLTQIVINSPDGGAGIFLGNTSSHVLIRDCYIYFTEDAENPYGQGAAVQLYNADNVTIDGCQFLYNHIGVMMVSSHDIEIGASVIVEDKTYADGQACVYSIASSSCHITGCDLVDGQSGSVILDGSRQFVIANNTMMEGGGPALSLYGQSSGNLIWNNSIANSYYGVDLQGSSKNNTVQGNHIENCTSYGIISSGTSGNMFYDNMMVKNNGAGSELNVSGPQAFDDGANDWNVSGIGNYWSDLQTDADNDGFADGPYPVGGGSNQDHHAFIISLTITAPAAELSYTRNGNITISGTASNGVGIGKMTWYNKELDRYGACSGTTSWTGLLELRDGYNNVTVIMTDVLGGRFSDNLTVVKSDTGALISLWPGNLVHTNVSTCRVLMNMTDAVALSTADCTWCVGNIEQDRWSIDLAGVKNYTLSLNRSWLSGSNVVNVTVTDILGNVVSVGVTIIYDSIPPQLQTQTPVGTDVPTNSAFIVKFSEEMDSPSVKMSVGDVTGAYYWNGPVLTFVPKETLQAGMEYDVHVSGKDLAGNWLGTTDWTIGTASTCRVYGAVADSYGKPLSGASVSLGGGRTTTTDSEGNYFLDGIEAGDHILTVWSAGYETDDENITLEAGASYHVTNIFLEEKAGGLGQNGLIISVAAILASLGAGYAVLRWAYREPKKK